MNVIRGEFKDLYLQALRFKVFAKEHHYAETLFGRKRMFPLITDENWEDIQKQATNTPIQGTASDINLLASMRCETEYPEVLAHMLIHDSFVPSIPKNFDPEKIAQIMRDVPFESKVKFDVEYKISDRWGQ
jgi:DNA polymerase-1